MRSLRVRSFPLSPVSWPFFLRTVGKIHIPSQFCPFSSDPLKGLELPRQVLSNINGDFSFPILTSL